MSGPDKKIILIVGASGFVGRALVDRLKRESVQLRISSRDDRFVVDGAEMYYGDLQDEQFCRKLIQDVDTIYYLAAKRDNIYHHTTRPYTYYSETAQPLLSFLSVLHKYKDEGGRFIFLSSVLVEYASDQKDEDGYLLGKSANEISLRLFEKEHPNWNIVILRSAAVYGSGDRISGDRMTFIPSMIRKIMDAEIELVVWGNGERKLQFIYIGDLVENLVGAWKHSDVRGIVSVGNAEDASVDRVVGILQDLLKKKLNVRHDISKPSKETHLIDFQNIIEPKIELKDGLHLTVDDVIRRSV